MVISFKDPAFGKNVGNGLYKKKTEEVKAVHRQH
jgi:hypothetical protein